MRVVQGCGRKYCEESYHIWNTDFLKAEEVEVVYLSRNPEISTTQIINDLNEK